MKNLIQEIQNDIFGSSIQLSTTLRKAKVLAYRLGNVEFKYWVNNELDGYAQETINKLPDYRKGSTHSLGHFSGVFGSSMRNTPIPTFNLPEGFQKYATELAFFEGIRALESLLESAESSFRINWPADASASVGEDIFEGYFCVSAWKTVPRSKIEQILDTVRNRLLSFILELEDLNPDIGKLSPGEELPISDEKVQQVFNTYILGGENTITLFLYKLDGFQFVF